MAAISAPGAEAEQDEEQDLVHVVLVANQPTGPGFEPAPSGLTGRALVDSLLLGGPIQPDARLNSNLPCVVEELDLVVADRRRVRVLAALQLTAPRARAGP